MGNALVRLGGGSSLTSRVERTAARDIAIAQARGSVLAARESAKVDAIAEVTQMALVSTSEISALEALLVSRTPHAQGRLQHIADAGVLGIVGVVVRTGSKVR